VPVIIFDFFGVICSEIAPDVLPRYMTEEDAVRFKATIVQDADLGFITQSRMFEQMAEIAHVPAQRLEEDFYTAAHIDTSMVALIRDLRRHHKVGLLTNAVTPFFRDIDREHGIAALFDAVAVSSEEHLVKPDPAFYRLILARLDAQAEDSIFIDDNPSNIEAAAAVGIKGILFTSAEQARAELAARFKVA
jgi:epoxide hydrolase-like predicted phosphatase